MPLTENARYILAETAKGRSLCFSQDGDMAWLHPSQPTEFLSSKFDTDMRYVIDNKLVATEPDPEHWTAANSFDITDAGRKALAESTD